MSRENIKFFQKQKLKEETLRESTLASAINDIKVSAKNIESSTDEIESSAASIDSEVEKTNQVLAGMLFTLSKIKVILRGLSKSIRFTLHAIAIVGVLIAIASFLYDRKESAADKTIQALNNISNADIGNESKIVSLDYLLKYDCMGLELFPSMYPFIYRLKWLERIKHKDLRILSLSLLCIKKPTDISNFTLKDSNVVGKYFIDNKLQKSNFQNVRFFANSQWNSSFINISITDNSSIMRHHAYGTVWENVFIENSSLGMGYI